MNEHTVKSYEEELALLDKKIARMGGLSESILGQSFDALERLTCYPVRRCPAFTAPRPADLAGA